MGGFMYYDSFADEFCLPSQEDRVIAPPERFLRVYRGVDVFIETWAVSTETNKTGSLRLDFAYSKEDRMRGWGWIDTLRDSHAQKYNCKLGRMLCWTIPKDMFDKYYPASD